jgi:hypothetical protein
MWGLDDAVERYKDISRFLIVDSYDAAVGRSPAVSNDTAAGSRQYSARCEILGGEVDQSQRYG